MYINFPIYIFLLQYKRKNRERFFVILEKLFCWRYSKMKTVLILSAICACAFAAPSVSIVSSPLIASPLLARAAPIVSPIGPIAQPLLAKVEGEAPASTVHATHVKQVLAPQIISYSIPAAAPQIISSYSLPAFAPAHVISAYSLPHPIVS